MTLDPDSKWLDESTLFGGSPARFMRLSPAGRAALAELLAGPVRSANAAALARRLTDGGLAHPRPPGPGFPVDAVVIIPVRDRPEMLAQCLAAQGSDRRIVVVDDGSAGESAIAEVCAGHGATVVRRPVNGGPAAARNAGLIRTSSDLVAFLDSDCIPPRGWIEALAVHFADPLVAAVAPRIVAMPAASSWAGRYTAACGSLDLGDREARVLPGSRVAYVPTAALVVRRAALLDLGGVPGAFDEEMRWGEDVDLVWRLIAAGWRVRYDPSVQVRHHEPQTWPALLARRFRYGTSAAPLARRHPGGVPALVLRPWLALTVAGLLARRPAVASACLAASMAATTRLLRRNGLPSAGVATATLGAAYQTWLGMGRYCTQFAAPLLAAAVIAPGSRRRGLGRRVAAASLLAGPALAEWAARRPALDPARFTLGRLADDIAYGTGVWSGCVRKRTIAPILPVITRRPERGAGPAGLTSSPEG